MRTLAPLVELIRRDVLASDLLHADDTPIRVLDRSQRDKGLGFLARLIARFGQPRVVITDKLRSYFAPLRNLAPGATIGRTRA